MHNGDTGTDGTPPIDSRKQNLEESRTAQATTAQAATAPGRPRAQESNRTWASRRADAPSWADGVEQF
jgi:hypothetical protein